MTWGEFIESEHNNGDFQILHDMFVRYVPNGEFVTDAGLWEKITNIIINKKYYMAESQTV